MSWKAYALAAMNLVCLVLLYNITGCGPSGHSKPESSFYYWKSVFRLSAVERSALRTHHIRKLYVKLYDVGWDEDAMRPQPIAVLQCPDTTIREYTIVPVIFITNQMLAAIDSNAIPALASNIVALAVQWQKDNVLPVPGELQLDCDWTASTRDKYFYLIREIRGCLDGLGERTCQLSATIRLYQCKYRDKTGVPPVAKGLLMCYNMGNLPNPNTRNSILSPSDLAAYTHHLDRYPLPLDVAFPLFDWKVLFRNGKYTGLIKSLSKDTLRKAAAVRSHGGNRYSFLRDTSLERYDFMEGDMLRDEESDVADIQTCAERLRHQLKAAPSNIILFHLDSANLSKYTDDELESIFNSCH